MSGLTASRGRLRRIAVVVASVLGHGLALALLGLTAPGPREVRLVDPFVVPLEIWTPPPAAKARHRTRAAAPPPSPVMPRRAAVAGPTDDIAPLPLPVAPGPARPAATATAGLHPGPLPGEARGGDLRGALRGSPVGCANRDTVGLTRREREACDDAWGKGRDQADIAAPIDRDKREAWDAVAARKARARRRKEAPPPPGIDPTDNAGGTRTNGIGILGY
ncbi:MAG: hypothetical protein Q7T19_07525 [Caulobacter sp.]|nr:hypothetical protein [Caulobacter sp.]